MKPELAQGRVLRRCIDFSVGAGAALLGLSLLALSVLHLLQPAPGRSVATLRPAAASAPVSPRIAPVAHVAAPARIAAAAHALAPARIAARQRLPARIAPKQRSRVGKPVRQKLPARRGAPAALRTEPQTGAASASTSARHRISVPQTVVARAAVVPRSKAAPTVTAPAGGRPSSVASRSARAAVTALREGAALAPIVQRPPAARARARSSAAGKQRKPAASARSVKVRRVPRWYDTRPVLVRVSVDEAQPLPVRSTPVRGKVATPQRAGGESGGTAVASPPPFDLKRGAVLPWL